MNSSERVERAIQLQPVARNDVPVAPLIITCTGRLAGIKQAEIFSSVKSWRKAVDLAIQKVGVPDMGFAIFPRDIPFSEEMRHRLPGRELGDDELFQLIEEEVMTREDYETILKVGFARWNLNYFLRLDPSLPRGGLGRTIVTLKFIRMGLRIRGNAKQLEGMGVVPAFYSAFIPPFDLFSMARSINRFSEDLYDCPELLQKASEASVAPTLATAMQSLMPTNGKRISIYPMRSSVTFISPKMFEKYSLPALKQMTEFLVKKGITPILHCDANWTPLLHFFRELPKAKCILELDGDTDIFKAKEVLGDWMCLKGDVPAQMLAFGEVGEVEAYCEKLIRTVGNGGGFILSSGCEVPLNAKLENIQAMIRVARGTSKAG